MEHEAANVKQPYLECACTALRRASRSVTQLYDLVLSPTGLKTTQLIMLRVIASYGPVPQWRLAQDYAVSTETLSRRLANLRRKGLLELRIDGSSREHVYRITEDGKRLLEEGEAYWSRAQDRLQQALGENDWNLLMSVADRITAAAADAENLRTPNLWRGGNATSMDGHSQR